MAQTKDVDYVQPGILALDSDYLHIGFSVVNNKEELISGEVALLKGSKERIKNVACIVNSVDPVFDPVFAIGVIRG